MHHRQGAGADAPAPAGGDQLHPHPRGGGCQPRHLQPHRSHGAGVHLSPRPVPPRAPGQARSPHRGPELPARLAGDGGEIPPHHALRAHRRGAADADREPRRRRDGLPGHRRHHSGRGQLRLPGLRPPLRPPGRPGPLRPGPPERRRPHPAHQRAVRAPGRAPERPLPAAHHRGADPGPQP